MVYFTLFTISCIQSDHKLFRFADLRWNCYSIHHVSSKDIFDMLLKYLSRAISNLASRTPLICNHTQHLRLRSRVYVHRRFYSRTADQFLRAMTLSDGNCETEQLIDLTAFPSLYCEENVLLHKLFIKYGFELRMAGGAVRDVLLGIEPKDIDFATDATPSQMHEMFTKENIRLLNRNGEAHGTVTVRINDKVSSLTGV